jgi:hypothetical protein
MTRLQQSRRQKIGLQYSAMTNNNISATTNARTTGNVQVVSMTQDMAGMGLILPGQGLNPAGVGVLEDAKALISAASGPVATTVQNLLPSGDPEGRSFPQFVGEHHAILRDPDSRFGFVRASNLGPGTQVAKRIKLGIPPRTAADKVAQAHDIRYGLAQDHGAVRKADRRMVKKLKSIEKNKQDSKFNTQQGMRGIQAKILGENLGVLKPGQIATFGGIQKQDRPLLEAKLAELEQEGFGSLPGEELKRKLIKKNARRAKKSAKHTKGGRAGSTNVLLDSIIKLMRTKMLPGMLKKLLGRGKTIPISGSGKLDSLLHMRLLKVMNNKGSKGRDLGKPFSVSGRGVTSTLIKKLAVTAAKTIIPVLLKILKTKGVVGRGMQGTGRTSDFVSRMLFKAFKKLVNFRATQQGFQPVFKGDGMNGSGFFSDFAKGFKKGFLDTLKVAGKVAKVAAPFAPLLLA